MGDYGLKISKTGYGVGTTDDRNLVLSSSWRTYKIKATGTASKQVPASNTSPQSVSVAHGMSYVPTIEADVTIPSATGNWKIPTGTPVGLFNGNPAFDFKVDATNVTFYVKHASSYGSAVTYTFNYVIFIERII